MAQAIHALNRDLGDVDLDSDAEDEAPQIVVRQVSAPSIEPRVLTADLRKAHGLPAAKTRPTKLGFAALMVGIVSVPMLLLGWYWVTFGMVLFVFAVVPGVRAWERRDALRRERVFTHGLEVVGRVSDVEPGGPDRGGKIVRVSFKVERPTQEGSANSPSAAGLLSIEASVFGCALARRGLRPGDDVVVYYDPAEPLRCLIASKIARNIPKRAPRPMPAPRAGGCGSGGCGTGGCGGGRCGGGGCGGGGCGGGGCR